MSVRILFVCFGLLIISCQKQASKNNTLIDQIPNNTAVIFKINDFNGLKSNIVNNDLLTRLDHSKLYSSIHKKIGVLKNVEIYNQSVLGLTTEDKKLDFYLISYRDSLFFPQKKITQQRIEHPKGSYHKIDVEETSLYKLNTNNKTIICSSKALAEKFLDKPSTSLPTSQFSTLYDAADLSKPVSIIINSQEAQKTLTPILLNTSALKLNNLLDWMLLDVDIPQKKIAFNGIGLTKDSLPRIANLFKNTNAVTNKVQNYAPMNTDAILSFTFDDYGVFRENRTKHYGKINNKDTVFAAVEEIGLIFKNKKKSVVLQTFGADNLTEYINRYKKSVSEFQGSQIIALNKNDILNNSFEVFLTSFEANFYTVLDDAFIFSKEKEQLQQIISSHKNGSTLSKSNLYKNAKDRLAEESSILFLSKEKGILPLMEQYFTPQTVGDYKKSKLENYFYTFQMVSDHGFFHTNGSIQQIKIKSIGKTVSKMFTVQLENDLATNPQFVTNHRTKKKEIVIQDNNNQLYLISTNGKVLWKKQLDGKIQGKISQIDIYKNGRLQLAFTTENQFFVLDRNGKEVSPFNIKYKEGGLNELAVFDYEKKKEYRFLITQGKNTYMYNNKGKIVDGFLYKKASGTILSAPTHFKINKKDYLVFKQTDGLKILSRRGLERVKGFPKIKPSNNEVKLYKNSFAITDTIGTFYQINQKGKTTRTKFNMEKDHGFDATSKTLVIMDNNTISIKGKKTELELGIYSKPKIFYINDKIYVTVTDVQNQKIYLFDSLAKPIPNFPVYGNSVIDLADIDNDKKLELIAKDLDNSIVVYKIN